MKVLLLSRWTDRSSSRFRSYQFIPFLRKYGIDVTPAPLFGEHYLEAFLNGGSRSPASIIKAYARRVVSLIRGRGYDLLWLERETFPWLPTFVEAGLLATGKPYIVDYDDAWFHRYNRHPNSLVRSILGHKIDWVMRHASLVIAGNSYLAEYAKSAGARQVCVHPTGVDLDVYSPSVSPDAKTFTVGWLGSPNTAPFLLEENFRAGVEAFCRQGGVRLVLVGSGPISIPGLTPEIHAWDRDAEAREVQAFDVGVSPLIDSPFARGKCGFKLVQYMACERPVVASAVGFHNELVEHGRTGFLVNTASEWLVALNQLRSDAKLRQQMGHRGRKLVEQHYSVQGIAPKLAQAMQTAASVRST